MRHSSWWFCWHWAWEQPVFVRLLGCMLYMQSCMTLYSWMTVWKQDYLMIVWCVTWETGTGQAPKRMLWILETTCMWLVYPPESQRRTWKSIFHEKGRYCQMLLYPCWCVMWTRMWMKQPLSIIWGWKLFMLQVIECRLVVDPRTRESRGFGFVTMDCGDDADRCVKYLNRSTLEGRIITVEKVRFLSMSYSCFLEYLCLDNWWMKWPWSTWWESG